MNNDNDNDNGNDTLYRFTVNGPEWSFRVWPANQDVTESLTSGYDEPATRAEIEELVACFDGNSSVEWDGLIGQFTATACYGAEVIVNDFVITLSEVTA